MKKSKIRLIILLISVFLCIGISIYYFYDNRDIHGFLRGTHLNYIDVSGKMPDELAESVSENYQNFTIQITESGNNVLEAKATELGLTYDHENAVNLLNAKLLSQKNNFFEFYRVLFLGENITIKNAYIFDESSFRHCVSSNNFTIPREASKDARYELNSTKTEYIIADATTGNEVDDIALQDYVLEHINKAVESGNINQTLVIEIPKEIYTSTPGSNDKKELEANLHAKNLELKLENKYKDLTIAYTFGKQQQILSGNTILNWMGYDKDENIIIADQNALKQYVSDTAKKYDSLWLPRSFKTTDGQIISIDSSKNAYGYKIDQDAEIRQLKQDILSANSISREPIYQCDTSYGNPYFLRRNGLDDMDGTYVEVSISQQHIWFYKNHKLVVESACVTGKLTKERHTITGAYPLAYKQRNRTLTGGSGANRYSSKVGYWMPFNLGQGLHDATWRNKFGGDIYIRSGSHGCVNLPVYIAKTIYENIETGTAIVIY